MKEFSGKVALVTGAGNGFGKAFAIEAARRGMKVALVDIDENDVFGVKVLLRQRGVSDVMTVTADLSDFNEVKRAVKEVMDKFGRIDVLFNNAGVSPLGDVINMPVVDYEWTLAVNTYGHFYMLSQVLPIMIKQGTPAYVMEVASSAGVQPGSANGVAYCASKHATLALAEDLKAFLKMYKYDNIGVSVFCPGFIQTDLYHFERHRPERFKDIDNQFYKSDLYKVLMKFASASLQTGMPIDNVGFRLFKAIEDEQMYVQTHTKYLKEIEMRHRNIEKDFAIKDEMEVTENYEGKVALITGAAHGFGQAFTREAAKRGMKLALVDIDEEALNQLTAELKESGAIAKAIPTDVSLYEEVKKSVETTMQEYGRIDVLFNNAGVATTGDIVHTNQNDWDWVLGVNLLGQTYYYKEVLPIMIKQKTKANIISTASVAGLQPGVGINPSYSVSKNGMIAVSECVKDQLERYGFDYIKLAIFCPGFIQTNLYNSNHYRPKRFAQTNDPEHYETEIYKGSQERFKQFIVTGLPLDGVGERLFAAMEDDKTYIITHKEFLNEVKARHKAIEDDSYAELTYLNIEDKMY